MPTETPELPINIHPLAQRVSEKLFDARTVLIFGEIDSRLAREVTAQLLAFAATSDERITIYLHSQGGHVESADSIFDVLEFIKPKVVIVGTGWVASAGAHIYIGVPKEQRYCLPNTRFLLHQPWGGAGGRASDLEIEAEEILKMRARLSRIIAERTGQPLKRVEKDTERNFWMSAEQARDYGLVGEIITSADQIRAR
jgi:ATP-dependent Clp protease protease subunit